MRHAAEGGRAPGGLSYCLTTRRGLVGNGQGNAPGERREMVGGLKARFNLGVGEKATIQSGFQPFFERRIGNPGRCPGLCSGRAVGAREVVGDMRMSFIGWTLIRFDLGVSIEKLRGIFDLDTHSTTHRLYCCHRDLVQIEMLPNDGPDNIGNEWCVLVLVIRCDCALSRKWTYLLNFNS